MTTDNNEEDDLMLNLNSSETFNSHRVNNRKKADHKKSRPTTDKKKLEKKRNYKDRKEIKKDGERYIKKNDTVSSGTERPFEFVSSLFTKNPEIPQVCKTRVDVHKTTELFTKDDVESTDVSEKLIKTLQDRLNFKQFTTVQKRTIPVILANKDVLVKSPTGSGKTLAYALPIVQKLQEMAPKINRNDGPYAVVLLPTRELALQSYNTFETLCRTFVWIVPGLIIGGEKRKAEKSRIRKGINIIIATPGRLLDHLKTTQSLTLKNVSFVVFDEADRLLDLGFEQTIVNILSIFDEQRKEEHQTILLSATLNSKVSNLASISLNDHLFIDLAKEAGEDDQVDTESVKTSDKYVTPESLRQYFVIVPAKLRLATLLAFILEHSVKVSNGKLIAFFSSKSSVELHYSLLQTDLLNKEDNPDCDIYRLHGDMEHQTRCEVFTQFKKCKQGILLCTDVAARGLDLSQVNWIVQYCCPSQIDDYVHRVGRTARIGATGQAIIFLLPSEVQYIEKLREMNIQIEEKKLFDILTYLLPAGVKKRNQSLIQDAATELQNKLEQRIIDSDELKTRAEKAFKSFIQAYATYPSDLKDIFHVKKLHLGHVAKSFALRSAPQQMDKLSEKNAKALSKKELKKKIELSRKRKRVDMSESGRGLMLQGPRLGGKKKRQKTKLK
eukprot:gene7087-7887_t